MSDELMKAQKLANTITSNTLMSKIKRDPSADLSKLLQQQASAYPQLRSSLIQAAQQRAAAAANPDETSDDETYAESPEDAVTGLLIDPEFEIIDPLSEKLRIGADAHETHTKVESSGSSPDIIEVLNQAIRNGKSLWALHHTSVLALGESVVVKIGRSLDSDGISNQQYINTHAPEIPVPSCLGSLKSSGRTYVFMSRADGVPLDSLWSNLSAAQKSSVQSQLTRIFSTLRSKLPNAGSDGQTRQTIGSFVSGICKDTRRMQRVSEKPIHTETEFNDFLCSDTRRTATPWIQMVRSYLKDNHQLVMTHGDLHPRNIMVEWERGEEDVSVEGWERQIRVTSLIDWELGGWYPEYWEFVKALSTIDSRSPLADWWQYLPTDAIGLWPAEFSYDLLISRWLG